MALSLAREGLSFWYDPRRRVGYACSPCDALAWPGVHRIDEYAYDLRSEDGELLGTITGERLACLQQRWRLSKRSEFAPAAARLIEQTIRHSRGALGLTRKAAPALRRWIADQYELQGEVSR